MISELQLISQIDLLHLRDPFNKSAYSCRGGYTYLRHSRPARSNLGAHRNSDRRSILLEILTGSLD